MKTGCSWSVCSSKQKFGSYKLHIEFRLPYQPEGSRAVPRQQRRLYAGGVYEVQILDSFGLEGKEQTSVGGLYELREPEREHVLFLHSRGRTYDIDYTAAKYDGEKGDRSAEDYGCLHNGVLIHKDAALPADRGDALFTP